MSRNDFFGGRFLSEGNNRYETYFNKFSLHAQHRITTGSAGAHFCMEQWRLIPDLIFLAFDFCWRKTKQKPQLNEKHESKVMVFWFVSQFWTKREKKINSPKPFISESLVLLWAPLEEHCRNSIPVCPICKRAFQYPLRIWFPLSNTIFLNKKCRKHIFIVE